jgi:predicted ATP-dependent protease
VQAVGGVNEKVEGFHRVCAQTGALQGQGVLLPASNVEHLMLNREVRESVRSGAFSVYPVTRIDEAIELMTGMEAGEPDSGGQFPEGSFNRLVADRLAQFAESGKSHDDSRDKDEGDNNGDR